MTAKLFRAGFLLISLVLLVFLFVVFRPNTPEVDTQEELMDYYKEIYGEDCVIQLPRGEIYKIRYTYNDGRPAFDMEPIYPVQTLSELYIGDLFSFHPAQSIYSAGEEINILVEYHGNDPWYYDGAGSLEILIDEQWYPLNNYMYYPGEFHPVGKSTSVTLTELFLRQANKYIYNEDSAKYEWVNFVDLPAIQIRPGHYRYIETFNVGASKYRLSCEFDVVQ